MRLLAAVRSLSPRTRVLNLEIQQLVEHHKWRKGWSAWSHVISPPEWASFGLLLNSEETRRCNSGPKKCASYVGRQFILQYSVDKAERCVTRRVCKMPKDCAPLVFPDTEVYSAINKVMAFISPRSQFVSDHPSNIRCVKYRKGCPTAWEAFQLWGVLSPYHSHFPSSENTSGLAS